MPSSRNKKKKKTFGTELIVAHSKKARRRAQTLQYHVQYNKDHKESLAARKHFLYHNDPAYRRRTIAAAQRSNAKKRKLREEARAVAGGANPAHKNVCKICHCVYPRPPKPIRMLLEKRFEVLMFNIRGMAKAIGRHSRTIAKWVSNKWIPQAMYKSNGVAYWTEDQVEAIRDAMASYDLRPPISFEHCGVLDSIKKAWKALLPVGIDTAKYTLESKNHFRRPPLDLRKRLRFARVKRCPSCGRTIAPVAPPQVMLVEGYEVTMYTYHQAALALRKHFRTVRRWVTAKIIPNPDYFTPSGKRLFTEDQVMLMKSAFEMLTAPGVEHPDMQKFAHLMKQGFAALEPLGINTANYHPTGKGTFSKTLSSCVGQGEQYD